MTEAIYMVDSYLKEFDSVVEKTDGTHITLERSAFYPSSGGQPNDLGKLIKGNEVYAVLNVFKDGNEIVHEMEKEGLKVGDKIHGVIDWERRHKLMRMHTAAHLLSAVIHKETGALITGNQLNVELSRIDFNLEKFEKNKFYEYCKEANALILEKLPVKSHFIENIEKDEKLPTLLLKSLPENLERIRVVEIEGRDIQADGGTHVGNTEEIGEIELTKVENKGRNNRRIYYRLKP
jgi:misacylated tRNA(Ala) deacylase